MKILFVNNLPLADSESGVYTTNLAKDLTDNGHECAILFPENTVKYKKYGDIKLFPVFFKDEEEIEDQVEFNFPCFSTHPRSHYNFMDMSRKDRNEYLEVFFRSIYKAIYEFEPDIIHGQNLWELGTVFCCGGVAGACVFCWAFVTAAPASANNLLSSSLLNP